MKRDTTVLAAMPSALCCFTGKRSWVGESFGYQRTSAKTCSPRSHQPESRLTFTAMGQESWHGMGKTWWPRRVMRFLPSTSLDCAMRLPFLKWNSTEWRSSKSKADWCVASLRKTCPLPDGGVLWSPAGHSLPRSPDVTDTRREASLEKLVSMLMKRMFLEGARVDKETFRSFSVSAEQRIASGSVSGMSDWARMMLRSFPFMRWRALRAANYAILSSLVTTPTLTRLEPQSGACPFSFVFLFRCHAERELVRAHLLSHRIYPSILWNLERPLSSSIPKAAVAFSERMLSLHCDYRYGAEDMEVVADVLKRVKYLRIGSVDWQ